jgi:eukaryotic-like serine/threonine-protein kinase
MAIDNKMGWTIASPAVRGGVVYFPTSDGQRFKAIEAASGKVIFDVGNKAVSFSSPALAGGTAYFGASDGLLNAVDAKTGNRIAQFETDGHRANGARYLDAEGRIDSRKLYPDQTLDGMIIGLERMYSLGSILSSPAIAEGVLYVGSTDGTVYALR